MNEELTSQSFGVGDIVAGKLRILRLLGEGGMGAVFEVEHEITRHRRALKLLHSQMAAMPAVVERFLREASAAGRIGNPHIVETFDAGRLDTGEPYIVMELLKGKSLADLLSESGQLEIKRACDLLVQACDGVHAAHAAGIVHRDLKPENLFLTGPDCSFVKILDFGISKFDAAKTGVDGLTMEGTPIGTPYYMSPEQIKGEKEVDARSDVYALGVLLYECLTGVRPFESDNLLQLIFLVSKGEYVLPSQVRASLPKTLDTVVSKAMSLDRSHRYATAEDLAHALSRLRQSIAPTMLEATVPAILESPNPPQRGTLAMTPEPVSKTLGGPQMSKWPHRSSMRFTVAVGLGVLILLVAAIALGPSLLKAHRGTPEAGRESGAQSSAAGSNIVQVTSAMSSDPSASEPPIAAATAGSTASMNLRLVDPLPATTASGPPTPAPRVYPPPPVARKIPGEAAATGRAASYGLSKDNPFKKP
jgi:eukaryotic-like serine/threonine-protein kinase